MYFVVNVVSYKSCLRVQANYIKIMYSLSYIYKIMFYTISYIYKILLCTISYIYLLTQ